MPTYEYECTQCNAVTDLKHGFREAPPTTACPKCGASPLKRLFKPAGIVFKGSGFYINDSRGGSGGSKSEAKSEAPKSDGGGSSDSSSSGPKGDAAA